MSELFKNRKNYQQGSISQCGVLLVNLGTSEMPTTKAVRRYLKRFLSDSRVIEIPQILWKPLLYLFILPLRSPKIARAYQSIWLDEGSPLLVNTLKQVEKLKLQLKQENLKIIVEPAMCYSHPDIEQGLKNLHGKNVDYLLILPMYPQYSSTTTAATFDIVSRALHRYRWLPEMRFINHYYNNADYITACADQICTVRKKSDEKRKLVFSFHGLPKRNITKGDPYFYHCQVTTRLIAEELNLMPGEWELCFQSRFGHAEWIQPYTSETLQHLAKDGVRAVDVFCPGFVSDCLETLEEIAMQNRDIFLAAGGENFRYIPALNDSSGYIHCLTNLIKQHTQGWDNL